MPILLTRKQISLQALTNALLTARATAAQREAALTAIRRANPGLTEGRIPRGTPIVLPHLERRRVDLTTAGATFGAISLQAAADQLDEVVVMAVQNADRAEQRAASTSRELETQLADGLRDGQLRPNRADADAAIEAMKADAGRASAHAAVISQAVPHWQREIKILLDIHDRISG